VRSLLQFAAFQGLWLAAVLGAARGHSWFGPLALVPYLAWMLAGERQRGRLALRWIAAGLLGSLADCGLAALGLLAYPMAPPGWPAWLAPPHVSLAWLTARPALAALLGALGGPVSFAAGARAGAVGYGTSVAATSAALALEYALAMPLLLRWSTPRPARAG
jgi:hypothetical protein